MRSLITAFRFRGSSKTVRRLAVTCSLLDQKLSSQGHVHTNKCYKCDGSWETCNRDTTAWSRSFDSEEERGGTNRFGFSARTEKKHTSIPRTDSNTFKNTAELPKTASGCILCWRLVASVDHQSQDKLSVPLYQAFLINLDRRFLRLMDNLEYVTSPLTPSAITRLTNRPATFLACCWCCSYTCMPSWWMMSCWCRRRSVCEQILHTVAVACTEYILRRHFYGRPPARLMAVMFCCWCFFLSSFFAT